MGLPFPVTCHLSRVTPLDRRLEDVALFNTPRSIDQIADPDQGIFNHETHETHERSAGTGVSAAKRRKRRRVFRRELRQLPRISSTGFQFVIIREIRVQVGILPFVPFGGFAV